MESQKKKRKKGGKIFTQSKYGPKFPKFDESNKYTVSSTTAPKLMSKS